MGRAVLKAEQALTRVRPAKAFGVDLHSFSGPNVRGTWKHRQQCSQDAALPRCLDTRQLRGLLLPSVPVTDHRGSQYHLVGPEQIAKPLTQNGCGDGGKGRDRIRFPAPSDTSNPLGTPAIQAFQLFFRAN
jgi:hypothetical protein